MLQSIKERNEPRQILQLQQVRIRTPLTVIEGYLKNRNWFRPGRMMDHTTPMDQARKVHTGMSGSSVFATADRTSGYGESSSASRQSDAQ